MAGIRITTMLEQSVEVDMLIKSPTAAASGVEHKYPVKIRFLQPTEQSSPS